MRLVVNDVSICRLSVLVASLLLVAACGGGGGDGGPSAGIPGGDPSTGIPGDGDVGQHGSSANYMVGDHPIRIAADSITIGQQTVSLSGTPTANTPIANIPQRSYRVFDTQGATSGSALEVHVYGESENYDYVQFGSWAKGVVSPNPGFTLTGDYGAFAHHQAGATLTPASNMPLAGSVNYEGQYAGYVERNGMVLSDRGIAHAALIFTGVGEPWMFVEMVSLTVDEDIVPLFNVLFPTRRVTMTGPIAGNTFSTDVQATKTTLGHTSPRGDTIQVMEGTSRITYANSGGMRGGFFGNNADEVAGVYQYTAGSTKAAGAFGGSLQ